MAVRKYCFLGFFLFHLFDMHIPFQTIISYLERTKRVTEKENYYKIHLHKRVEGKG